MLSSYLLHCLPLLVPVMVPWSMVLTRLIGWHGHTISSCIFDSGQQIFIMSIAISILQYISLFVMQSLYKIQGMLQKHLISMACILFCRSCMRVHVSHTQRNTDNKSVCTSLIFVQERDMFLSFQMIFSQNIVCVACAILDRISCFEPSSVTIALRYLNWLTVSSIFSLILMSSLMPSALFVITFVFSVVISMLNALAVLLRCLMSSFNSPSLQARPLISSTNCRLVMTLSPKLMVPAWSSRASIISFSRRMFKRVGESKQPCLTQGQVQNYSSTVNDSTAGFIVELFYDAYQVVSDVVMPHSSP